MAKLDAKGAVPEGAEGAGGAPRVVRMEMQRSTRRGKQAGTHGSRAAGCQWRSILLRAGKWPTARSGLERAGDGGGVRVLGEG
jgi:hypothetical protein